MSKTKPVKNNVIVIVPTMGTNYDALFGFIENELNNAKMDSIMFTVPVHYDALQKIVSRERVPELFAGLKNG